MICAVCLAGHVGCSGLASSSLGPRCSSDSSPSSSLAFAYFIAFRSGTPQAGGGRVVQLRNHADVVYVTTMQARVMDFFKIGSLVGLGIGVPGFFAVQAIGAGCGRLRPRRAPASSPDIVITPEAPGCRYNEP